MVHVRDDNTNGALRGNDACSIDLAKSSKFRTNEKRFGSARTFAQSLSDLAPESLLTAAPGKEDACEKSARDRHLILPTPNSTTFVS